MKSQTKFTKAIKDSISVKERLLLDEKKISQIIQIIYNSLRLGGKVMLCGNGGSAADAQHLAAEFTVRLRPTINRKPIPAISLSSDISTITACANDYGYDEIFSRQAKALAQKNDSLIVYTTSGKSANILKLIEEIRPQIKSIISLTGNFKNELEKYSDVVLSVKSEKTTRIQEIHAIAGHIMCECVESTIFKRSKD